MDGVQLIEAIYSMMQLELHHLVLDSWTLGLLVLFHHWS